MMDEEYIKIPITQQFDHTRIIGGISILKSALPNTPDWVLTLGYKVLEKENGVTTKYSLITMGLVNDEDYINFLKEKK